MRRMASVVLAFALGMAAFTVGAQQAPKQEGKVRCTLTNKVVEKCCCEQREGKTYCPLAKKSVEKCCCVSADDAKAKNPKK